MLTHSQFNQKFSSKLVSFLKKKTFEDEHLSQLSKECSLTDMLAFDDADHDGHLNLNEFYAAFSKLYSKIDSTLFHPSFLSCAGFMPLGFGWIPHAE